MTRKPRRIGRLLALPRTDGAEIMIDPAVIASISPHRRDRGVTVIQILGDLGNKIFVALDYEELVSLL